MASRVQTFCIGMEGSPDVEHARMVAQHLNTEHHEIFFTQEEGFQAVRDVIYTLETYDSLTIRGAVAMYLVAKYVKENTNTTILFSGNWRGASYASGPNGAKNALHLPTLHLPTLRLPLVAASVFAQIIFGVYRNVGPHIICV